MLAKGGEKMAEISLALPQPETTPNTVLPANVKNAKPSSGKKDGSFGAILDSTAGTATDTKKTEGNIESVKPVGNDNLAFWALGGIMLTSLIVNTEEQQTSPAQPAGIAESITGVPANTTLPAAILTNLTTQSMVTPKQVTEQAVSSNENVALESTIIPNVIAQNTQTVPTGLPSLTTSSPAAPVRGQTVDVLPSLPNPEPVLTGQPEDAGNIDAQKAAIIPNLLNMNSGQEVAGDISGNNLAVLSVTTNPIVTTATVVSNKSNSPMPKKADERSIVVNDPLAAATEGGSFENVVTAVMPKENSTPGKEEQQPHQDSAQATDTQLQSLPLPDQDSNSEYAKVESGLNRQAFAVENVQVSNSTKPVEVIAPVTGSQAAYVPEDPHNITSQIVEQARMINRVNNSEMVVKLKPEHLGELTLKVSVENGAVSASFHSNNSEVRTVIEASLTQLRQELSNQGLKVENVGVYAGLNQFFSNDQQQAAPQQQIKFKNRKQEQSFIEAAEAISVLPDVAAAGVDYRI